MKLREVFGGAAGVLAMASLGAFFACNAERTGANASVDAGALASASASAVSSSPAARAAPARPRLANLAAYIPAQCYAETRSENGSVHNACFACHQDSRAPNYAHDEGVQTSLTFARFATENHWTNLLTPPAPASIDDEALLAYVRADNYAPLAASLRERAWPGFVPDCAFHFDDDGFDRDARGELTGWRAFAYAPMPGMFWPTNGSAGDAMIRLPAAYRSSLEAYRVNLAIVEAYVRRVDVPIAKTDERLWNSDLDGDGVLATATRVAFVWPPREGSQQRYVGDAAKLDPATEGRISAGLLPRGTEMLHSVRYLDVEGGKTRMASRMKELRYMRKERFLNYSQLELAAESEAREKRRSPDRLRWVIGDEEHGLTTGTGWVMQGFIEDARGTLRPQTTEETAACIGCHGGVGVTTDSTFSFARKLGQGAARDGWYSLRERGLTGIPEPKRADGEGEYARWLEETGGGDDFRANDEIRAKAFAADGHLDKTMRAAFAKDIAALVVPSSSRAMALDRAYLGVVRAQAFARGREVVLGTPHVRARVTQEEATGIDTPVPPSWAPRAQVVARAR